MKRSPLKRTQALSRKQALSRPPQAAKAIQAPRRRTAAKRFSRPPEPGEAEWKQPRRGRCVVCGQRGRVVLHHCVREQDVRRWTTKEQQTSGIAWFRGNAMLICAPVVWGGRNNCHDGAHRFGVRDTRVEFAKIPESALRFAEELMGDYAMDYWRKFYRDVP